MCHDNQIRNASGRLGQRLLSRPELAAVCDDAGVTFTIGARARAGRKINASAYMLLCSAAGLDAATGAIVEAEPRAGFAIAWWLVGCNHFLTRRIRGLDLRSAALVVGVSAATLSRAECGEPVSIECFLRISCFIGIPPKIFLCPTPNTGFKAAIQTGATDRRLSLPFAGGQPIGHTSSLLCFTGNTNCNSRYGNDLSVFSDATAPATKPRAQS